MGMGIIARTTPPEAVDTMSLLTTESTELSDDFNESYNDSMSVTPTDNTSAGKVLIQQSILQERQIHAGMDQDSINLAIKLTAEAEKEMRAENPDYFYKEEEFPYPSEVKPQVGKGKLLGKAPRIRQVKRKEKKIKPTVKMA